MRAWSGKRETRRDFLALWSYVFTPGFCGSWLSKCLSKHGANKSPLFFSPGAPTVGGASRLIYSANATAWNADVYIELRGKSLYICKLVYNFAGDAIWWIPFKTQPITWATVTLTSRQWISTLLCGGTRCITNSPCGTGNIHPLLANILCTSSLFLFLFCFYQEHLLVHCIWK